MSFRNFTLIDAADPQFGGVYQFTQNLRYQLNKSSIAFKSVEHKKENKLLKLIYILIHIIFGCKVTIFNSREKVLITFPFLSLRAFKAKELRFYWHDIQEEYYPENFTLYERFKRRFTNYLLIKKSSFIYCENIYTKNTIQEKYKVESTKIIIATVYPKAEERSLKYDIDRNRGMYFYPANFWIHKNHGLLIEVALLLKRQELKVTFALTGQDNLLMERFKQKLITVGVADYFDIKGFVSEEEMAKLYTAATALIMPSLFESVSIPIYEAMQYAVPIISSNAVGLPEQVGSFGVVVDPMDPNAFVEIIMKCEEDPNYTKHLAKQSHEGFLNMALQTIQL